MSQSRPALEISDLLRRPALRALLGLLVLIAIAAIIAPRTLALETLVAMAPFIGILGMAAIGQHLVIQQRGFDLSVAGSISLAAVIVTVYAGPADSAGYTLALVLVALLAGTLTGLLNGVVINGFGVPPLVMTIGTNALTIGFCFYLTNAAIHASGPPLTDAANLRIGGLSILFLAFAAIAAVMAWALDRTRIGRRFIMSAVSPHAARALGVAVNRYNIATYALAGFLFALVGVMIAGLSVTPTLQSGGPYMLTTVAAVIVGGSPLNGDRGSVLATVIGSIFIVFLNQLVVSLGFDYAIQSMVQAAIILAGVTVPELLRGLRPGASAITTKSNPTAKPHTAPLPEAVLTMTGVRKVFGRTVALAGVDFSASPGEVHAIIGENGAGKSTLISIAAGVLSATDGEVRVGGLPMDVADPNAFRKAGVSVAFQHPPLPSHLTVLECFCIADSSFGRQGGAARARDLIARVTVGSLGAKPEDRIADLSIGQRHVVEIARALASNPRILILDEPTEPFKEDDVAQLFTLIRSLKAQGVAIIYISHRLNEVEEIADRISVLRDGELIATRLRADFTRADIIGMIVGRPLGQVFPAKAEALDHAPVVLSVKGLTSRAFDAISFDARRGEIIGIAGVEGQGQRELLRAIGGLEPHTGTVLFNGAPLSLTARAAAWAEGIAFVPDDRHHEGLFLSLSVADNLGVGHRSAGGQPFIIDREAERKVIALGIEGLKIRTASSEALVSTLSGGNQQKVLMGREISAAPRILLTDEPTKGVDIGSKSDIYTRLRELAREGVIVIVASSDGVELEGLCDRVLVMARGTVAAELSGAQVSDAEITAANLTAGGGAARPDEGRARRFSTLLNSAWLPVVVLSLASFAIFYMAASANMRFLSAYNLGNVQVQLATLALIAFGQLFVMLLGEIDFSAGPMAGLVVVLVSFWIPDGTSTAAALAIGLGIVGLCALIGYLQGMVVVTLRLPSIVVTLASFFALQGISLSLRPQPGGTISSALVDTLLYAVGPISAVSAVVILGCVWFERVLFRSPFGRALRAVGSDRASSAKLGLSHARITPLAFALNGALIGIAGLILAATIGVGTGTAGVNFTLMSITAVVLGGAVISGGYGSFVATLFGALLVQATFSSTAFMQVGVEWQYWLVGLSTLFAASLFSLTRRGA